MIRLTANLGCFTRHVGHALLDRLVAALIVVALGLAYTQTLAPGITWANNGADSGDLVTAAATLGIAHPTGYPTYLLLARLFQLLPVGDLAFRTNILSAVAAVFASLCVYVVVRSLCSGQGWISPVAAGLAALGFGLSSTLWSQAVVAEVYSLNALFAAVILVYMASATRRDAESAGHADWLQGLVVGLGLGDHVTLGILAVAWLATAAIADPPGIRLRLLGRRVVGVGVGALVYLYLPLRAAAHPPINWGNPRDWAGFWWVVSGEPYRGLAFGLPPVFLHDRWIAWAGSLRQQFGWIGIALGFFGLFYGAAQARLFAWATVVVFVAYSIFAIAYNTPDSAVYLIPAYLIFATWMGLGAHRLLRAMEQWDRRITPCIAILLVAFIIWTVPTTARSVDVSHDRRAIEFATRVLAAAPVGAIVVTSADLDTFALWYYHYALGARPDVAVVVEPLLDFDWYRESLRAIYPGLQIPDQNDSDRIDTLIAANREGRSFCRTSTDGNTHLRCGNTPPR
jgi:Protein O-mannosyl-transferase TMEM260-like